MLPYNVFFHRSFLFVLFLSACLVFRGVGAAPAAINGSPLSSESIFSNIKVQDKTSVTISSSVDGEGGMIAGNDAFTLLATVARDVLIANVTFSNGFSSTGGGCLSMTGAERVTIISSVFKDCSATPLGGGVLLYPSSALFFSLVDVQFTGVSAFLSAVGGNDEFGNLTLWAGSGAAVAVVFNDAFSGNDSVIELRNVVVTEFSQVVETAVDDEGAVPSLENCPLFSGGAILFMWKFEGSGNDVALTADNVTFSQGDLSLIVPSRCSQIQPLTISSAAFAMVFVGEDSGDRLSAEVQNLSLFDLFADGPSTTTSNAFGFFFLAPNSGNGINASLSYLTFRTVTTQNLAIGLIAFTFFGANSGTSFSVAVGGEVSAISCTLGGSKSSVIGATFQSENSGNDAIVHFTSSTNALFRDVFLDGHWSSIFGTVWDGAGSGHSATVRFEGRLSAVDITCPSLLSMAFLADFCGVGSHIVLSSTAIIELVDCPFFGGFLPVIGSVFSGVSSGANAGLHLAPGSRLLWKHCSLNSSSQVGTFVGAYWQDATSGNSARVTFAGNVSFIECLAKSAGSFVFLLFEGRDSGNDALLSFPSSATVLFEQCVLLEQHGNFVSLSFTGNNSGSSSFMTVSGNVSFVGSSCTSQSQFVLMEWLGMSSGIDSGIALLDGVTMRFEDCVQTGSFNAFVQMFWGGKSSGDGTSLLGSFSFVRCSVNRQSQFLLYYWSEGMLVNATSTVVLSAMVVDSSGGDQSAFLGIFFAKGSGTGISVELQRLSFTVSNALSGSGISNVIFCYAAESLDGAQFIVQSALFSAVSMNYLLQISGTSSPSTLVQMSSIEVTTNTLVTLLGLNFTSRALVTSVQSVSITMADLVVEEYSDVSVAASEWEGVMYCDLLFELKNVYTVNSDVSFFQMRSYGLLVDVYSSILNVIAEGGSIIGGDVTGAAGYFQFGNVTLSEPTFKTSFLDVQSPEPTNHLTVSFDGVIIANASLLTSLFARLRGSIYLSIEGPTLMHFSSTTDPTAIISFETESGSAGTSFVEGGYSFSIIVDKEVAPSRFPLLLIEPGVPLLGGIVGILADYDPQTMATIVEPQIPQSWTCPVGFSLEYNLQMFMRFFPLYSVSPYNCLEPRMSAFTSCQHPYFYASVACEPCPVGSISLKRGLGSNTVITNGFEENGALESSFLTASSFPTLHCQSCPAALSKCGDGPSSFVVAQGFWMFDIVEQWDRVNWSAITLSSLVQRCPTQDCLPQQKWEVQLGKVVEGSSFCSVGRDPVSPLCSRCLPGLSASILSSECRYCEWGVKETIGVVGIVLLASACVVYLLLRPLSPQAPWLRVVTYFYSVLSLLFSSSGTGSEGVFLRIVSLFGYQSASSSSSSSSSPAPSANDSSDSFAEDWGCVPFSSPSQVIFLPFVFPALIMVVFVIVVLLQTGRRRIALRRGAVHTSAESARSLSHPLRQLDEGAAVEMSEDEAEREKPLRDSVEHQDNDSVSRLNRATLPNYQRARPASLSRDSSGSLSVRFLNAAFSVLLLFYSSIAGITFALSRCVWIPVLPDSAPGNDTSNFVDFEYRLFRSADLACWDASLGGTVALLGGYVLVIGVPLSLFIWQGAFPAKSRPLRSILERFRCLCQKRSTSPFSFRSQRRWKGLDLMYYIEGELSVWYWDAVLFLRRALLELVGAFAERGLEQQCWLMCLNLVFGFSHALARPYRSHFANGLEMLSLMLLCFINALNLPPALVTTNAASPLPFAFSLTALMDAQNAIAFAAFLMFAAALTGIYSKRLVIAIAKTSQKKKTALSRDPHDVTAAPSTPYQRL